MQHPPHKGLIVPGNHIYLTSQSEHAVSECAVTFILHMGLFSTLAHQWERMEVFSKANQRGTIVPLMRAGPEVEDGWVQQELSLTISTAHQPPNKMFTPLSHHHSVCWTAQIRQTCLKKRCLHLTMQLYILNGAKRKSDNWDLAFCLWTSVKTVNKGWQKSGFFKEDDERMEEEETKGPILMI